MSFVVAAPEAVTTVAQDLAGIHSSLSQVTAAATGPTTAIVAAAEDEVSAAVAALFGAFGQEYHAVGAQAAAFHEQFVGALNGTAAAYLGAEAENAQLAVAAAAPGPYQSLVQNTVANLETLVGGILANPAPFLRQTLLNTTGYLNTIAAQLEYVLQNFPAVVAGAPAGIEAGLQGLLALNPATYLQQFITNQITYTNIWATSLQKATHDFLTGVLGLPAAFQSAWQQLLAGNLGGAVDDVAGGFLNLLVSGVSTTTTGNALTVPVNANVALTGTLADLNPIISVPGLRTQYLTNLLPPGSIPAQISQNVTNVLNTVTNTSLTAQASLNIKLLPPNAGVTGKLNTEIGLPTVLTIEAFGATIDGLGGAGASVNLIDVDLQAGNWAGAIRALVDAPALVANDFLNGESTLPISFDAGGYPAVVNLPLDGLLVPVTPYTATISGLPLVGTLTITATGTPISGLATGLFVYAPEQLAAAITP